MCRRVFSLLVVASAPLILGSSPPQAEKGHNLVRIPLFHNDNNDVNALLRIGDETFAVAVDTGSSDSWVAIDSDTTAAAINGGPAFDFTLTYGSGRVSGIAIHESMRVLASPPHNELLLPRLLIGVVSRGSGTDIFHSDGVIGLGMEGLQQLAVQHSDHPTIKCTKSSALINLIAQNATTNAGSATFDATFSIYIDPFTENGKLARSQLIFGGIDPQFGADGETWELFPVVRTSKAYGFWALRLSSINLGGQSLGSNDADADVSLLFAVVDSGSSFILLPPHAFRGVAQILGNGFGSRFSCTPLDQPGFASFDCTCRQCAASDFPDLQLHFSRDEDKCESTSLASRGGRMVVLHGSDYVRCRSRECVLLLDVDPGLEPGHIILGAVFLRAYYTAFNYTGKEIALVRAIGSNAVALSISGSPVAWRTSASMILIAGLMISSTVMLDRWLARRNHIHTH